MRTLLLTLAFAAVTQAAETNSDFFEKKIRPVLVEECFRCHSNSADKLKANLLLDTRDGMLTGGDTGPAIIPGNAEKSLLIKAIKGADKDLAMPPKKKLSSQQIADFKKWVQDGAVWPGAEKNDGKPIVTGVAATYDKLRNELWSWQPIQPTRTPTVHDETWCKSDIDRFVLSKLEFAGIQPNAPADKLTLLRRATFDLTGLPPTPEDIELFTHDSSPQAFERVVDRLLASPQFGERWGRHWLDVARYADSTGMARNFIYFYAWRYRDYVIDSFNTDKPYDQFITEQLAGDLIPARDDREKDQHLIATGFLVVGPKDYNERNPQQFLANNVDEEIDAVSKSILATTVACARCHDHKFDPIPSADYYAMAGIFRSTIELPGLDIRAGRINKYSDAKYVHLAGFSKNEVNDEDKIDINPNQPPKPGERFEQIAKMRRRMRNPDSVPVKHFAMGVEDSIVPADAHLLTRGEVDQPGPVIPRGFLEIPCMGKQPAISPDHSGRLELAKWIIDPKNPLTARVMANRIWEHLFGVGIVKSVDNFGTTGEKPTNPQLLDYLALKLQFDNHWSIKQTVRQIMLSSAYQQSSAFDKNKFNADPENALLWRMNQRRLEGEAIRDAIMATSGTLNLTPPKASTVLAYPQLPLDFMQRLGDMTRNLAVSYQRSVYMPLFRNDVPSVLEVFDMADPNVVDGSRDVTTVAPQALFMMNSQFVATQAVAFSNRVASGTDNDAAKVDMAYRLALGRDPTKPEKTRALDYLHNSISRANWPAFCQALLACAEFRYVN